MGSRCNWRGYVSRQGDAGSWYDVCLGFEIDIRGRCGCGCGGLGRPGTEDGADGRHRELCDVVDGDLSK